MHPPIQSAVGIERALLWERDTSCPHTSMASHFRGNKFDGLLQRYLDGVRCPDIVEASPLSFESAARDDF